MTKILRRKLVELLTTGKTAPLVASRVYKGTAPEGSTMPYIVIGPQSGAEGSHDTSRNYTGAIGIIIQVWATAEDTVADILDAVEYDVSTAESVTLAIGKRWLSAYVSSTDMFQEPNRDDDGEILWQGAMNLTIEVENTIS